MPSLVGSEMCIRDRYSCCCWELTQFFPLLFLASCSLFLPSFYSLSLLVVTQTRGHVAGSSPPPLHYGTCLAFWSREDSTPFFPRRLPIHERLINQNLLFFSGPSRVMARPAVRVRRSSKSHGSGRRRKFSKYQGSSRLGSARVTLVRPDPTREFLPDP